MRTSPNPGDEAGATVASGTRAGQDSGPERNRLRADALPPSSARPALAAPTPADAWLSFIIFVLALAGYLHGAAPGLLWGDSAEMQILAAVGGVAHPTGYPLFTLVGRLFTAFGGGELAYRANLLSAVFAAATLALLVAFLRHRGVGAAAATAAALAWGLSFTYWSTAQRAEVYSLAAFVALMAIWVTLTALESGTRLPRLAAGFLLGLTLAGHLAFAPVVAVAGLTLAWQVPRRGAGWFVDEAGLLAMFLLGLTPYLYLSWADVHGQGLSYLKLVEIAQWPVAPVPESFRPAWARLVWLLTARNEYPPVPFHLSRYLLVKNVSDSTFLLGLFEFGPIAFAIAVFGVWRRRVTHPRETAFLFALAAASLVFSIVTAAHKILSVFLIPCYLVVAVYVGHGMQLVHDRLSRTRLAGVAATVLLLALPIAGAALAHAARLATYDHPLGRLRSKVEEEDDIRERHLLPSMAGYDEPRRFVESAARSLPDSALVICEWREFMAMLYLQRVEHRRTDLTVQPSGYPVLLEKVGDWQSRYALASRPVVVVSPLSLMRQHLTSADTLRLATGQAVVVTHTPLLLHPGTPPTPAARESGAH